MKETINKPFGELDIEQKIQICTSALSVPQGISKEEAFKRLSEKIDTETVSQPSLRISKGKHAISRFFYSAAAIVVILIACGVIMSMLTKTVTAPRGSHIEYTLADGSTVNLNSDSQIKFKKYRFNKNRTIKLEGEAYFYITSGKTFTVNTYMGSITVLGTAFNVYARDNNFSVNCLRGKVRVDTKDSSAILTKDQGVELSGNVLKEIKEENGSPISWIEGEFFFENAPLKKVIVEVERQFNVTFAEINNQLANKNFTGSFSNQSLDIALDIICTPLGLEYETNNGHNIVLKERD